MSRKDRKFKRFFRQKLGDLQKKKKKKRSSPKFRVIFRRKSKIQTFFPPKIRWSKKKKKKKKGLRQNSRRFFFQNFASSNVSGGAFFAWGGLFSIFHRKSASKAQKTCDFAYFTSQWGGLEPPPPPPGYATELSEVWPSILAQIALELWLLLDTDWFNYACFSQSITRFGAI